MELELRIRQEIVAGGTQTTEQTTATDRGVTTANTQILSSDTGEAGQSVLQSRVDLGWHRESGEATPCHTGTERIVTHPAEQPAHTGAAGADQQEPITDTADLITGWEEEREAFFSAQTETTANRMDSFALDTNQLTTLGSDIIRLGRSVESLALSAPVIDSTTQIVVHERKRGHGHKKDNHESQEYKMTM